MVPRRRLSRGAGQGPSPPRPHIRYNQSVSMKPADEDLGSPFMTRLTALSASRAVLDALAQGAPPRVLGLYTNSANLISGDQVFSLVEPSARNLPRGILVRLPPGFAWKDAAIAPGARVEVDGPRLRISPRVEVDLSCTTPWEPRRRLGPAPFSPEAVRRGLPGALAAMDGAGGMGALAAYFYGLAAGTEPDPPSGNLFQARGARLISEAMACLHAAEQEGFLRASIGLVGLGIGLTPSGDDILTGLVGSLVLLAERIPRLGWLPGTASRLAEGARGRTTDVGLTYLRCAAEGEIAELQERLLAALVAGEGGAAGDACRELRAFGHSSGGEIALGTLLAAESAARLAV